ncbi:TetR family transcriptional regulator [Pseudomonas sp. SJZ079]|uniref:TetR/AcrR family transcriptional regulator n=1 Tax=Pseudomonas sp. SJZ079 TaxID=2572887 RepID=UPI00119BC84E|nr:TetR family transcriptional regulator [Pseudomonas sp. SJZ079]TWC31096.1 TetR family transcriptional regulator [Pseudomonas sp. SJZ079]
MNSHSMQPPTASLKPRKTPIQARSQETLEVIHQAAIQVLMAEGLARCNTTRVAARAGVSVGSLYQYYPNRAALLAAVLAQHLEHVARAVECCCLALREKPLVEMAQALANAFLDAKMECPDVSKALYAVAEEHGGAALVGMAKQRMHGAVAKMLSSACDARFEKVETVALLLMAALAGPVRALLEHEIPVESIDEVRRHLLCIARAYLTEVAIRDVVPG